jgi:hypothetical protein
MLRRVFMLCWRGMLFTYFLLFLESVCFSSFPYLLGKSVDSLLLGNRYWFYVYILCGLSGMCIGIFRRLVDTRVFGRAWSKVSSGVVFSLLHRDLDSGHIINRAEMSVRFVDFFEFCLPDVCRGVVGIFVSLFLLNRLVPSVFLIILSVLLIRMLFSLLISFRIKYWDDVGLRSNDLRNESIGRDDNLGVELAYNNRVGSYIRQSDWNCIGWFVGFVLMLFIEVLIILALVETGSSTGDVLSSVGYVWNLYFQVNIATDLFMGLRRVEAAQERISDYEEIKDGESN